MINPHKRADVSFTKIRDLDEQGCFSTVYLAHDQNLDHELIIKEIPKSAGASKDEYFTEARLLYKHSHSNIVQVQYAAECNDNVYIAMPFYQNGSLQKKIETYNLTSREIIRYSIQFLSGLYHIHSKGLMHFDIKPNNILISNRDEALLSDFGLSKLINTNGRATPDTGYFFHIPPEYFSLAAAEFNLTYDIYQAGLTMYRMCVGNIAFENERSQFQTEDQLENAICNGTFPSKNYPPHIPKKLISIIDCCLKVDPNDRYQSTLDVLNDLSDISDGALDWRYQPSTTAGQHEWHKTDKDVIVSIVFDASTASTTGKRIYPDNSVRKITALSISSGCTPAKLYKLLKDN